MRIIAGSARGRKLAGPGNRFQGPLVRPTSDRAREALFNIIRVRVPGAIVLDLFAGTGAVGIEALSRGASRAVFVEKHPAAVRLVLDNIARCGFSGSSRVVKRDLGKGLFFLEELAPPAGFDLVFLDPPYASSLAGKVLGELAGCRCLNRSGLIIVEAAAGREMPVRVGSLSCYDQRRYGEAGFWFYRFGAG